MDEKRLPAPLPAGGKILIYRDGAANLQVRLDGQTVWLTQAAMAELFQTTPQNISLHLHKHLTTTGELQRKQLVKEYLQVRPEGGVKCNGRPALQSRRHSCRRLSRPIGPRHGLPPVGYRPPARIARQRVHPRRRTHQGRTDSWR